MVGRNGELIESAWWMTPTLLAAAWAVLLSASGDFPVFTRHQGSIRRFAGFFPWAFFSGAMLGYMLVYPVLGFMEVAGLAGPHWPANEMASALLVSLAVLFPLGFALLTTYLHFLTSRKGDSKESAPTQKAHPASPFAGNPFGPPKSDKIEL